MIKKLNYIFTGWQKAQIVIIFFMILIGAGFELLGVSAVLPMVEVILEPAVIETEGIYKTIADLMGIQTHTQFCITLCLMLCVVYVVKNAYLSVLAYMQIRFSANNRYHMACRMFSAYVHQDYLFHTNHNVADFQRDITIDIVHLFQMLQSFLQMLTELVTVLVLGIFLLFMDAATAITMGGIILIIFIVFGKGTKEKQKKWGTVQRESATYKTKVFLQAFAGIKDIHVMDKEHFFCAQFDEYHGIENDAAKKTEFLSRVPKYVTETIIMGGMMVLIAIRLAMGEDINNFISVLSVYAVAAIRILPSANRIIEYANIISNRIAYIDGVYSSMQIVKSYEKQEKHTAQTTELPFLHEVRLESLSYKYPEAKENLFENVSLTIRKNESVAFIGSSGAGKTTIADIILGLLPPQSGRILVDNQDIRDNMELWHKKLGYVPQNIYLMDDTIRNNIGFGMASEEIDDEAVWYSLKRAQLDEFVGSLPDGLNTIVGDRGVKLSGGQRQRIGIARALLNNPDILILDEATSALDNDTEKAIMEAIEGLQGKTTLIIIAHRLSTIRKCDRIFEVGRQKVTERCKEDVLGETP